MCCVAGVVLYAVYLCIAVVGKRVILDVVQDSGKAKSPRIVLSWSS